MELITTLTVKINTVFCTIRKILQPLQLTILTLIFVSCSVNVAASYRAESSATLTSQYLFRGFDMTQDGPALQGDYIITEESGFWFGVWASNYNFVYDDGVEIDLATGYEVPLTQALSLTFGMTEYIYTGEVDNTTEFSVSLTYSNVSFTYYDDVDLKTIYMALDAEFEIVEGLLLALHVAEYDYETVKSNRDYNASFIYAVNPQISILATYSINDLNSEGADEYVVFSMSYSF